jgi:hypothetical protein
MQIALPYLMFLGDVPDQLAAKTAHGVANWRPEWCLGQWRLPGCRADLGLPDMIPGEAVSRGARTLVVGVTNAGGVLPDRWTSAIVEAIEAGMDVASGLHVRLQARRPAAPHRRHRPLGQQEVNGPRAGAGHAGPRPRRELPRHRVDGCADL